MPDTCYKFTKNHKSMKIPFIIYASMESLLQKIQVCGNDLTKLFSQKIKKHTACLCLCTDKPVLTRPLRQLMSS